jgi:hypothetical protein
MMEMTRVENLLLASLMAVLWIPKSALSRTLLALFLPISTNISVFKRTPQNIPQLFLIDFCLKRQEKNLNPEVIIKIPHTGDKACLDRCG